MKNIVLITGLVRDEKIYMKILEIYLNIRDLKLIDEIVFSTD